LLWQCIGRKRFHRAQQENSGESDDNGSVFHDDGNVGAVLLKTTCIKKFV
jgi:hypothetical protein